MLTLLTIFRQTQQILQEKKIVNAALDAQILVEWGTNTTKKDMILTPEREISPEEYEKITKAIEQRLDGKPVYRIIGQREFYGMDFELSEDTLEPRQDTEILVDALIALLQEKLHQKGKTNFLDMGTGTGAIAIAALRHVPKTTAIGVDIARGALAMAQKNADKNGVAARFDICESNWFSNVKGQFDFIVSNPPYIKAQDIQNLTREVRLHDPRRALDGGPDGLDFYRKLAQESRFFLSSDGYVVVEIGQGQELDVCSIFATNHFKTHAVFRDLSQIIRVIIFK